MSKFKAVMKVVDLSFITYTLLRLTVASVKATKIAYIALKK